MNNYIVKKEKFVKNKVLCLNSSYSLLSEEFLINFLIKKNGYDSRTGLIPIFLPYV